MTVFEYLQCGPATVQQIATATGTTEHLVRVILREAGDRDWCEKLPDGRWKLS